jgi:hypothetical protein
LYVGLACCLGYERTISFFSQRDRLKGSTAFFGGIVTVLLGWPILGMLIELYGFVALFGGFLPLVISFLRQVGFFFFLSFFNCFYSGCIFVCTGTRS